MKSLLEEIRKQVTVGTVAIDLIDKPGIVIHANWEYTLPGGKLQFKEECVVEKMVAQDDAIELFANEFSRKILAGLGNHGVQGFERFADSRRG